MEEKAYALKYRKLENWLNRNGYTHAEFAAILHISVEELYRKLWQRRYFNKDEIKKLINLLTAKEAVKVIFFPSMAEKIMVYRLVFKVK